MAFDIGVSFNVETQELVNARNALQSLTQAARDFHTSQEKASTVANKLAEANNSVATSSDVAEKATTRTSKSSREMGDSADAAAKKLSLLQSQLTYLRDDNKLTEVGFTKSQASVLAWAESVGASSRTIKEFATTFDSLNKVTGVNPFDKSTKGLYNLNRELKELEAAFDPVVQKFGLTSSQIHMLSRDIEGLTQRNAVMGKSMADGVEQYKKEFVEAASLVNMYNDEVRRVEAERKESQREEARRLKEADSLRKQSISEEIAKLKELEAARKSVNDSLMREWSGDVGKKSPELQNLSSYYEDQARATAAANKIAADAIAYTERESKKLLITNDLLARGFTSSSANAIFKYKEALERTGISAMELKQRLYLLEQDLVKRQGTSPFSQMQKDIKKVTEQTNHLARAISVQLGDVAISLAGGQNPFVVLLQQGDQIRGAVQQAKDAGQDVSKAMQGAFVSMYNSFKLVGEVVKEFALDGLRTVASAMDVVGGSTRRLSEIDKQYADGLISATRHARLKTQAALQLTQAIGTLKIVTAGAAAVFGTLLVGAFVSLSREQDLAAKSTAQFGAVFGATSQEALALSRSLLDFGVTTSVAQKAMTEMMKTGTLTKDTFKEITLTAVDVQKYVGISIEEVIKKFGELGKDPIKVLEEFTLQTGYLSQAQIQLARDHIEAGDSAKAQEVAIKLLRDGYREMAAQAEQDMSALKRVTIELSSATNTLWDDFKNSFVVAVSLKALKTVIDVVAVSVHAVATAIKDVAIVAAFAVDVMSGGPQTLAEKWGTLTQALKDNAQSHNDWAKRLIEGTQATTQQDAANKALNVSNQKVVQGINNFTSATEESTKALSKKLSMGEYAAKRLQEENDKATKHLTQTEKQAYFANAEYAKSATQAYKKYQEEWAEAQKKNSSKGASSYNALRDNELQETKKYYDEQLKQLKDFESKQSQINKGAYEGRAISYAKYVSKEIQLVTSSQEKQLAIINKSEEEFKANIEARKQAQEAAAATAIKDGANSSKVNKKLTQELSNLSNQAKTSEESFKGLREAVNNAANKKFADFFKEITKSISDSNDKLKEFTQTVADNARNRQEDLQNQKALSKLYGAEADAYKASTSTMRSYQSQIRKVNSDLEDAVEIRKSLQEQLNSAPQGAAYDKTNEVLKEAIRREETLRLNSIKTIELAQKDSAQAAADATLAYNLKMSEDIRNALSEDIYNALFEGGKKGGQSLKTLLKNMFKNYVINVILNPIMGGVANTIAGAFGFGNSSGGTPGTGSGLDFMNLGGNLGDWLMTKSTALGLNGFQGLSDVTFKLGNTLSNVDAWLKDIPGFGGGVGSVLGYGKAIFDLSEGKYGSAIGSAVGTYLLPGIGTAIGSTLGSLVDGMFGGGTPHVGASSHYAGGGIYASGAAFTSQTAVTHTYEKAMQAPIDLIVTTLGNSLDYISELFGGKRGFSVTAGFSADNDDPSAGLLHIYDPENNQPVRWTAGRFGSLKYRRNSKFSSDPKEGFNQYLQSVTADSIPVFKELVPKWAGGMLDALTDSLGITDALKKGDAYAWQKMSVSGEQALQALQNTLNAIALTEQGFTQLGQTMSMFSGISDEMKTALLNVFGSIQGVSEVAGQFYQNFYSEEERFIKAGNAVNEALRSIGVELDVFEGETAKIHYRALVEKAFSDGNSELAAKLLQMSGAFAEVANAAQGVIDTTKPAEEVIENAKNSILDFINRLAKSSSSALQAAYNSMQSAESLLDKIRGGLSADAKAFKEQRLWAAISTANYQDQITMANELADLLLEKSRVEQENAKRMIDFGKSLLEYVKSLKIGQLSPLTTGEKLAEAAKQYSDTLKKAQGGDEDAMRQLQQASSSYLDLARTYFASSEDYTKIFNSVTGSLESLGVSSQSDADLQIELATQNISQLKNLESIVSGAYGTAKTDFEVQKGLLQEQIYHLLSITDGIEVVRDILAGLSPELAGQISHGGTLGKPGGVGASNFETLAKQYLSILKDKSTTQDIGYVASYMANLDATKWNDEYYGAMGVLQGQEDRDRLTALFNRLAVMNGIRVDGSHKSGLDNVPFDGYVAELHKGERVLTARENRTYGGEMVSVNASLVARLDALTEEVNLLRKENREDARLQASVTAKASELSAKTIVDGVEEASSKQAYSNNLGAKLR